MAGPIRISILADAGKAKKEIGETDSKLSKLGRGGLTLMKGAALGAGAGVVALGAGLLGLAKGAAEDDAAQKTLAKTLKNSAGATDDQVKSVEAYISKVGAATGVTDDEMRPALAKLVRATGDVGKAQGLMNLAMDVSAGTGKDLGSVTAALAKAQNGSTGALGKLGVATKDASGKALSFDQIQKNLSKTFTGQAATAAGTLEGKQKRLKLMLAETGEAIGAKLLPVLTTLADFMLKKGIPALERFGTFVTDKVVPAVSSFAQQVGDKVVPVVQALGGFLRDTVIPALGEMATAISDATGFLLDHKGTLEIIAGVIAAVFIPHMVALGVQSTISAGKQAAAWVVTQLGAIKAAAIHSLAIAQMIAGWVLAGAQALIAAGRMAVAWLIALGPIGLLIAAIALVIGVIVLIATKTTWFQDLWHAAWGFIKDTVAGVIGWIKKNWPLLLTIITGPIGAAVGLVVTAFGKIKSVAGSVLKAISGAFGAVIDWFRALPGKIAAAVGNTASYLYSKGRGFLVGLAQGAVSYVGNLVAFWTGLPGRIVGWLGNVGGALLNAGKRIIQGLIDGIESKVNDLRNKLSGITNLIPDWKGPLPKDKKLLTPAGKAIIGGLISGMDAQLPALRRFLGGVSTTLEGGLSASPAVALAGAQGGVAAGGRVYQITVTPTATASPADIGREIVRSIDAYEQAGGRRRAT